MGKHQTVVVIGAGFSGIDTAIKLSKRLGIEADIFDYSSEVGGTWHANTYPGCACDVPSHLYSFSYELNPNWSENYSPQPEIYDYLRMVAKKYDVYKNLQLNTTVLKLEWIPDMNQWKVDYCHKDHPEQVQSKHYDLVVSAIGGLRVPKIPSQLKGFAGTVIHTAQWDSSVDFTGKRVGLVGSGASAVQVLPYLQKSASHLYNFQRTPSWVGPRVRYKYSSFVKTLFTWIPLAMMLYRWFLYCYFDSRVFAFTHPRSFLVRRATKKFAASVAGRLKAAGRPDLAISLMPDFALGCKRILGSEDYYETLAQENVTVIPHALDKIDGQTLYSDGQGYEVDILVLATGFDIQDHFGDLTVIGKDGVNLHDLWEKNSPKTYKTVMLSGFPNFFQLLGPGSALGHSSVIEMIECQANFCMDRIMDMNHYGLDYLEPTAEAQEKFTSKLIEDLKTSVWVSGGCVSWYQQKNGSVNLWSGSVTSFWWELKRSSIQDFVQTHEHERKKLV